MKLTLEMMQYHIYLMNYYLIITTIYSETSIHHFCRGSEKETMGPGKQ
jgi:hypothetical protein